MSSPFKLLIDNREHKLIQILQNYDIPCEITTLTLGDFHIVNTHTNEPVLIIERKSLADFASSIQDGRYNEQSFRLDKTELHNHNIIYIIEGKLDT